AVVDPVLARPALRVQPGVDDEPPRAEQLSIELAELPFDAVAVPAGFRRETLRVQAPSLGHRRDADERFAAPELRQRLVLHLQGELEVVARHGLVVHGARETELRHALDSPWILKRAGPGAVG